MSISSIISMILICGFIVGGFIYFLMLAIGKENSNK